VEVRVVCCWRDATRGFTEKSPKRFWRPGYEIPDFDAANNCHCRGGSIHDDAITGFDARANAPEFHRLLAGEDSISVLRMNRK
jgi:hypothetical protein